MSDHGHQPVTRALNMNRLLEQLGLLRMGRGSGLVSLLAWGRLRSIARRIYDRLGLHGKVAVPTPPVDWSRTRAYTSVSSTGEGVSIALTGREPDGTVSPADYERTRDQVAEALLGYIDPATGRHPIARVLRKEEVLDGAYLDRAPDLLLEAAPLYSLTHARQVVEKADWLSGDHRPEGIYVAAGPDVSPRRRPRDLAGRLRRLGDDRARRRARHRRPGAACRAGGGLLGRRGARGRGAAARARLPRVTAALRG